MKSREKINKLYEFIELYEKKKKKRKNHTKVDRNNKITRSLYIISFSSYLYMRI